jgi:hypothetical protein
MIHSSGGYDDPVDYDTAVHYADQIRGLGGHAEVVRDRDGYNIYMRGKYLNMSP